MADLCCIWLFVVGHKSYGRALRSIMVSEMTKSLRTYCILE